MVATQNTHLFFCLAVITDKHYEVRIAM